MSTDLTTLTIAESAAKLAAREVSSAELTEAYLGRIERLNPAINAFVTVTADRARGDAATADREIAAGNYRGPLHGIPIGLKDIYETAGVPTTGHSKVMQDHVPKADALRPPKPGRSVSDRLRDAFRG